MIITYLAIIKKLIWNYFEQYAYNCICELRYFFLISLLILMVLVFYLVNNMYFKVKYLSVN